MFIKWFTNSYHVHVEFFTKCEMRWTVFLWMLSWAVLRIVTSCVMSSGKRLWLWPVTCLGWRAVEREHSAPMACVTPNGPLRLARTGFGHCPILHRYTTPPTPSHTHTPKAWLFRDKTELSMTEKYHFLRLADMQIPSSVHVLRVISSTVLCHVVGNHLLSGQHKGTDFICNLQFFNAHAMLWHNYIFTTNVFKHKQDQTSRYECACSQLVSK